MFGNTIEPMSYLGFWGLGLLMSLQGSFIWCNGITSATSTFYHAHSQFPFRHNNAMLGSPGGSSMLWFSRCSRPRSNQNHFTSLSIPGVRLGNHVLRLEHFRCDVFSDPTGWWSTSWLASYSLWGWLMMSYTALAAKVDAMLATAICWLLASTRMLICACKTVLSSCSSSRVSSLDHCKSSRDFTEYLYFFKVWNSVHTDSCPHHKELSAVNVVLAQPCLLQGNCICRICALPFYWVCILSERYSHVLTYTLEADNHICVNDANS